MYICKGACCIPSTQLPIYDSGSKSVDLSEDVLFDQSAIPAERTLRYVKKTQQLKNTSIPTAKGALDCHTSVLFSDADRYGRKLIHQLHRTYDPPAYKEKSLGDVP